VARNKKTPSSDLMPGVLKLPSGDPMEEKKKTLGEPRLRRGPVLIWHL